MLEIPILLSSRPERPEFEQDVEGAAAALGLLCRSKGTLARLPGCIHWHFCTPGRSGTLELPLTATREQCWIAVHRDRNKDWVIPAAHALKSVLEAVTTEDAENDKLAFIRNEYRCGP